LPVHKITCPECGQPMWSDSKRCLQCFLTKHHPRRGLIGEIVDAQGYVLIKMSGHHLARRDGYVRVHRLAMEKKLGRRLTREEVVHHIDGDKRNNREDNLALFPNQGEHMETHHQTMVNSF